MKLDNYDILITKHLAEEISNSENEELNSWINTNEANKKYFEQKKQLWELADIKEDYMPDLELGLNRLNEKLNTTRNPSFISGMLKIAATAAILISLSIISYVIVDRSPQNFEVTALTQMEIINLPDNSRVWLNKGSTISYNSNFSTREIHLHGEAFFDVESIRNKPFIVSCNKSKVQVLGTSFVIKETPDKVNLSVLTGKVAFANAKNEKLILSEGENASFQNLSGKIEKLTEKELPSMEWRDINLFFNNQRLDEILKKVENYYGITIQLKNKELASCRFSGNLKNKSLKNIFELLKVSINLEVEEKPNHVFLLNGKNCG